MQIKILLQTIRAPFLILTPVCIFLGFSTAYAIHPTIDLATVAIIFFGAIAAHISVNTLNEYDDFKSGLDLITKKTPFSGGSGALPDNPEMAKSVLVLGLVSLAVTIIIGVSLVLEHGMEIMPIGLFGMVLIIAYTKWINRFPLLCLIAPGLGFGMLMVVGAHVVLTGGHSKLVWLISLVPFLLVNNLLLLNQYPDIEADSTIGRNTFPISFGIKTSNLIYAIFMLTAFSLIIYFIYSEVIPSLSVIALIPMSCSIFSLLGAIKFGARIGEHPQYLATNVAAALLTPLLLGISIVCG
jgi:1,4-dihydroxy-2-naphthoate polyprenyltransferase